MVIKSLYYYAKVEILNCVLKIVSFLSSILFLMSSCRHFKLFNSTEKNSYRFSLKKGVENVPLKKTQKLSAIVGANITARRKLKGWTQAEFAEKMGMGPDSLSRIERGTVAPRFPRLEEMARLLECSPADLFRSPDEILQEISGKPQEKAQAVPLEPKEEVIRLAEKIILLMQLER